MIGSGGREEDALGQSSLTRFLTLKVVEGKAKPKPPLIENVEPPLSPRPQYQPSPIPSPVPSLVQVDSRDTSEQVTGHIIHPLIPKIDPNSIRFWCLRIKKGKKMKVERKKNTKEPMARILSRKENESNHQPRV